MKYISTIYFIIVLTLYAPCVYAESKVPYPSRSLFKEFCLSLDLDGQTEPFLSAIEEVWEQSKGCKPCWKVLLKFKSSCRVVSAKRKKDSSIPAATTPSTEFLASFSHELYLYRFVKGNEDARQKVLKTIITVIHRSSLKPGPHTTGYFAVLAEVVNGFLPYFLSLDKA